MAEATDRHQAAAADEAVIRTFLIADVRGYTRFTLERGDAAAARLASDFADLVTQAVTGHHGQVIELRGDEALAVFTSARQALRAALELQQRCAAASTADRPIRVGVGLDAGEAIPVGAGFRGAALNLAARLCALAGPGEALASEGVSHLASKLDDIEYGQRGEVELKGFAEPVKVIEIQEKGPVKALPPLAELQDRGNGTQALPIGGYLGSLPSGPLVAREDHLARLLAALDDVEAGNGHLVLLAGEPGAGKTRLAQEVSLHARNRGFVLAAGRCYEPEQAVAYYPFLDVLPTIYTLAPADVRRDAGRRWPYLGVLLPDQIGVPEVAGGQDDERRVLRAVTSFLATVAATAPLAVLLDDLHWADGASLKLLSHLARHTRASPLLLLGTYRDVEVGRQHPLEAALRDLHREQLAERLAVGRLAAEGTRQLIAATIGEREAISDEFTHLVYRRTEGNPYFVQQVLRVLVERGDVFRRDGRWDRKEIEAIEVPESIRSVIGHRLSHLSEGAQESLAEASVLGQAFVFDDLLVMTGRGERDLERSLDESRLAGLVRSADGEQYAFDHALTQQALYQELAPRYRRRLHLAAGAAIESLPERQRQTRSGELAWHFLQGDDPKKALCYSLLSGDAAEASFAHGEAEMHYRTAVELAREEADRPQEAEALEKLGGTLDLLGRFDEALELLEQAAAADVELGYGDAERRTVAQIGITQWRKGTPAPGIDRLVTYLAGHPNGGAEDAPIYLALSRLYYASGRYEESVSAAATAGDCARELGDDRLLVQAEVRRGTGLTKLGEGDSLRVLEDVLPLAEKMGDLSVLNNLVNNIGFAYWMRGEYQRSLPYRERSLDLSRQIGDPAGTVFVLSMMAEEMWPVGEWERGLEFATQAVELSRSIEASRFTTYAHMWLGFTHVVRGEWDAAIAALAEGDRLAQAAGDLQALDALGEVAGLLAHLRCRPHEGIVRLEASLAGATEESIRWLVPYLAQLYLDIGEERKAEPLLQQGIALMRTAGDGFDLVDALRLQGALNAREQRWQEAERCFAESLEMARAMPYPLVEARTLLEQGRMRAAQGRPDEARASLHAALEICRRLGAKPFVEQVELALADLDEQPS